MLDFPNNPRAGDSYVAPITGQVYIWDGVKWIGTTVSGGGGGGGTTYITNENPFTFSVAADDSTQRSISNNELVKFIGAGTVTTSSDAEGNITITGTGGGGGTATGDYQFYVAADDSTQRLVSTDEVIKFTGAGGITTTSDAEGNITITGSTDWNNITNKPDLASTYKFYVAADDSTQRLISTDELIKFTGAGGITTSSDAEGYITITQGTTSSLVNNGYTVSLGSDGRLTLPGVDDTLGAMVQSDESIRIEAAGSQWLFGTDAILNLPENGDVGAAVIQPNGSTFGIKLISNGNVWAFGTNGDLGLPYGGAINTSTGNMFLTGTIGSSSLSGVQDFTENSRAYAWVGGFTVETNRGVSTKTWQFDQNGVLNLPSSGAQIANDVTFTGNVTFQNTANYVQSTNTVYTDSLIELHSPPGGIGNNWTVDDGNDIGLRFHYYNGGDKNAGLFLDNGTWRLKFVVDGTETGGQFAHSGLGDIEAANFRGNVIFPDGSVQNTAFFSFSVAADDSTQRVIGNNELVKFIGAGGITTASDSEGYITITQGTTSSLVNGAHTVSLGSNGKLTFPDGAVYAGKTVTMPATTNGNINSFVWEFSDTFLGASDNITLNWNLLASNTPGFYIGTTHSTNGKYVFINGDDQSLSYVAGGVPAGGKLKFGVATNGGTGGVDDIELTSSTGSVRVKTANNSWAFGSQGLLSLGANVGGIYANQTTGVITIGDNIAPNGSLYAPSTVINIGGNTNAFAISAYGPPARSWTFGMDGALTVPGDIKSSGNINIDINLSDSTLRRWSFGEDGSLTIPGYVTLPNNGELRPGTAAYDAGLMEWENIRGGEIQFLVNNGNATAEGWPMVNWHPTGPTAQGYIDFLLNAWNIQQANGSLIIYPALSSQMYQTMRTALTKIRDNYNLYSTGVSISSGYAKSWNFSESGDITFPDGTKQSSAPAITISADDSTQRTIYLEQESIKFIGAGTVTTSSDAEGNITITGAAPVITISADDSTQRTIYLDEESIKFIGAGTVTTSSDAEGNITITGTSGLPSQSGNSGKYLTTDGSVLSWATVAGGGGSGATVAIDVTDTVLYPTMSNANSGSFTTAQVNNNLIYNGVTSVLSSAVSSVTGTGMNLIYSSQGFSATYWTVSALTVTANNILAPDGTTTGALFTGSGASGTHSIFGIATYTASGFLNSTNLSRTISCYFQKGTNNFVQLAVNSSDVTVYANFDLNNGVLGTIGAGCTATISTVAGYAGWYRCTMTFSAPVVSNVYVFLISSATAVRAETNSLSTTIYAWGMQCEYGPTARTYIPTTTAFVYGTPALQINNNNVLSLDTTGNLSFGGNLLTTSVGTLSTTLNIANSLTSTTAQTVSIATGTNSGTKTINIGTGGGGANITLGIAASGTTVIASSSIQSGAATASLFTSTSSNISFATAATTLAIGSTGAGAITTLNAPTVIGSNVTQNLYNTVATTVNEFGAATTINVATNAASATTWTLGNPNNTNTLTVAGGTASGTDSISSTVTTGVINVFTGLTTGTLNIATGTGASTINIGGATSTTVVGNGLTVRGPLISTSSAGITAVEFDTEQLTVTGNRIATTVTNANLELECNGTGGVVINNVAPATTASTAASVGYLGLPQNATGSTTLTITDAGKHIYVTSASQTITIPAATSVAYPIGTTITFIAGPSASSTSIAITTDTMYLAGTGTTGTRTLAAYGMATAVKVSGTSSSGVWFINGTGLT